MGHSSSKIWDYVFVGAGILGVISGKYLKEKFPEKSILIIDKNPNAGQGNTIRSNAAYRNIFDTDMNIILSTATMNNYKFLQSNRRINLEIQELGYFWFLTEEQHQEKHAKTISITSNSENKMISLFDFLRMNNTEFQIFSKAKVQTLFPNLKTEFSKEKIDEYRELNLDLPQIEYGFLGHHCGVLSPDLIVGMFKAMYQELGGEFQFNSEATQILLKGKDEKFDPDFVPAVWKELEVSGIKVRNTTTNQEEIIRAHHLILTTGAWINQLLEPIGINSTIKAKTRQLFTLCNMQNLIDNPNFPNQWNSIPFLILPIAGIFIRPEPQANCVIVGCSDDIGREFIKERAANSLDLSNPKLDDPKGDINFYIYNILPVLQAYFPTIFTEKTKVKTPSAGNYAYSIDKFPVIEQDQKLQNLYFCSGASGSGIMKGDSIGRILVALIAGDEMAELFGGIKIKVSDFGLQYRNVPKESLVL